MKIFPAIDLKGGRVVRLTQGDYGRVTQYAVEPEEAARSFVEAGAKYVHIVDLDGAKDGTTANLATVARVLRDGRLFAEVGGGIRDRARIEAYLAAGASRVILGTAAVNDRAFLEEAVKAYGARVAVGVDARDGRVAVDGWQTVTALDGVEFCQRLRDMGVATVIYTDIARDGAMRGVNLEIYRTLLGIEGLEIVASGGVSTLEDVRALREMGTPAAIVGKALYSGALNLADVLKEAEEGA